jgi:hypothetical protein
MKDFLSLTVILGWCILACLIRLKIWGMYLVAGGLVEEFVGGG